MTMQEDDYEINHHYGRGDLGTTILAALQAAGKNPQRLTPDDLAPVDQFHTAGKQATQFARAPDRRDSGRLRAKLIGFSKNMCSAENSTYTSREEAMNQSDSWYRAGTVAQSLGEKYEQYLVPTIFGPWAADLVALAAPQSGEHILDVACGTGAVAREAARVIGAHGSVTGLDLNVGMLNIARAHDPQGTVQWREGSAQAMPFPDEAFTLVLCHQGMQYFPDRAAALREMYRVLASGGRLVLSVWRAVERTPGFLVLGQVLARHISPEAGVLPPFALGDAAELAAEVATAGFAYVTVQMASRLLRYDSPEEFARTYLISTPLADLLAQVEEARRTALLADVSAALQPYMDENGLAFPIESQIIIARK